MVKFVLNFRNEQCSKVLVYNMRTALLEEMNKMVKRIAENEQEVIKLSTQIEKKKKDIENKNKPKPNIPKV